MKCVGPHLLTEKKLNLCGRSGRINNRINRCSNIFCYRCIEVGYMNQGLHRPLYLTILSSHTGLRVLFRAFCSDNGLGILWRNLMARPIRILTVQLLNFASYRKTAVLIANTMQRARTRAITFFIKIFSSSTEILSHRASHAKTKETNPDEITQYSTNKTAFKSGSHKQP